jgi:cell division protein FtsB
MKAKSDNEKSLSKGSNDLKELDQRLKALSDEKQNLENQIKQLKDNSAKQAVDLDEAKKAYENQM